MKNYYIIRFPSKVTSRFFYKELLPEINKFINSNNGQSLLFDWGMVDIVNALVIPNLLMLGHQIRIICSESVKIFIPTKIKLLNYLYEVNFLTYSKRFYIYEFFDEYIGDYDMHSTVKRKTYYLENQCSDKEIWRMLGVSNEVIEEAYHNDFDVIDQGKGFTIRTSLWEMCKNSVEHGHSFSFLTIQREIGINKVMISAADTGLGIYNSFKEKILEEEKGKNKIERLHFLSNRRFMDLDNRNDKELFAILEAAFFRKEDIKYGLWNIIEETLRQDRNGVVRVHSNNVQVIFTNHFLQENFNDKTFSQMYTMQRDKDIENYDKYNSGQFFKLIENIKRTINVNISSNEYRGVHIEIELKLG